MHGTNNFDNMSADEMIIFLKDYVSPISSLDYYNKLNDAVQFPHFSSKFDITHGNLEVFQNKFNTFL